MRKGRLTKELNRSKGSIDWERFSSGRGGWIKVSAYLDARDMKTYAGLAEGNDYQSAFRRGFPTIEAAFEWAEAQVDYKKGTVKGG